MAGKKALDAAKHPASIWTGVILALGTQLIDKLYTEPGKEQAQQAIEKAQWETLNESFVELQKSVNSKWTQGQTKVQELEVELARIQTTMQFLTQGQRHEAKKAMQKSVKSAPSALPASRQITLPDFEEVRQKAKP